MNQDITMMQIGSMISTVWKCGKRLESSVVVDKATAERIGEVWDDDSRKAYYEAVAAANLWNNSNEV